MNLNRFVLYEHSMNNPKINDFNGNSHYDNGCVDFLIESKMASSEYDIYWGVTSDNSYKISIIIPIYNNELLIHRTLMSIINQSFNVENIEVLMVNDASTDNTPKIINSYADKFSNFKAIHIKDGSGSAGTPRNIGLKLASANYVMFLDHDDFLEINALEKLYEKILKYNCDFVFGTYVLIDNNVPIKFYYPNIEFGFFDSLNNNKQLVMIPPSIWTKLFKKDFLIDNNILFPTILGEDAIFMSKVLKYANGIYYLGEEVICYYNLNNMSYTIKMPYEYFVEGFISEKYICNLYCEWNQIEYYKLRGQGILNYYINRFIGSDLKNNEIHNLLPFFFDFCNRLNKLNIIPNNERNEKIFNFILNKDVDGLIKFKNYKPNKLKIILDKIFKHSFR